VGNHNAIVFMVIFPGKSGLVSFPLDNLTTDCGVKFYRPDAPPITN